MNELNILVDYLLENNYTSTVEDAFALLPSMSEAWVSSILDNYLEENYLFQYIMEMRKEDKVRGKKKTPLYRIGVRKSVRLAPKGSKNKWEMKRFEKRGMTLAAEIGRAKQGLPTDSKAKGAGLHGELSGYAPHPHGQGGRLRGVKKERGSKKPPEWGTPEHFLNQSKAYKTYKDRKAQRVYFR